MLNIEKSSLILILIIVVLIAGFVSLVTLGYTPGSVWHKAEDVKAGTFGNNVGQGNYNFPGNVGIKTPSPSSTLDVTGNIYATGQVTAGTKVKVGVSEMSSGKLTGLDRPTSANDATSKGYVDEQIAEVRAIVTGAQPLVNGAHTQQDCINAGGEVVDSDTAYKQCRFNASACPSGWTQYKNWSTTINPSSCGGCYCQGGGCCITGTYWASILRSGSCPSSHSWSNNPVDYAVYGTYGTPVGGSQKCLAPDCCTCTITSPITQIGCY